MRLAASARQDLRDILSGFKAAGGNIRRLSARTLKSAIAVQQHPGIGHLRPDVTDLPLLFFPTPDDILIVYTAEPFQILFFIPPWTELRAALRRRLAQSR